MSIDWSRPIEAVHEDGRVFAASYTYTRRDGLFEAVWNVDGRAHSGAFYENGAPRADWSWTIRNLVPVATPAPKYPEALVERIVEAGKELAGAAIVLRAANDFRDELNNERSRVSEAIRGWMKALAELSAEVDADEELASRIAMENVPKTFPTDTCGLAGWVLRGIKEGRALERQHAGEGRG